MRPLLILHIWRNMKPEVAEFTNFAIITSMGLVDRTIDPVLRTYASVQRVGWVEERNPTNRLGQPSQVDRSQADLHRTREAAAENKICWVSFLYPTYGYRTLCVLGLLTP